MQLADLEILALDCQATGAGPGRGQLLEIGWAPFCSGEPIESSAIPVESFLIQLPPEARIPVAVQRITGITDATLTDSVSESHAWCCLQDIARSVAAHDQMQACPTVIHYAKYEAPYLENLHHTYTPETPFPFHIICTHAIAVRLLPNLPRRGLRPLSGYFGHAAPEMKRSADHVRATLSIWQHLMALLQHDCDVRTFEQLMDWLAHTPPPKRTKRAYPMSPDVRRHLPESPGVYRMKRTDGDVLYVGKAKSLKRRVNSYFRNKAVHAEHILEMLTQARQLDYSVTATALSAAVLEADEIKRLNPQYNIALKGTNRRLVFLDKALTGYRTVCDAGFRVGPIPHDRQIDGLVACAGWIFGEAPVHEDIDGKRCADLIPWHVPEVECLRAGLDLFREKHRLLLQHRVPLAVVTSVGAQAWRQCLMDRTQTSDIEDPSCAKAEAEQDRLISDEFEWTPEKMAETVERILMRVAFLIRRARWFSLLSESSLAWAAAESPGVLKNKVIFEKGRILPCGDRTSGSPHPLLPGYGRPFHERRKLLDVAAYDRMRVVTTELRRLVVEKRAIQLRLWPGSVLGPRQLEKILEWV